MAIHAALQRFFRTLPNPIDVDESTRLVDILDSLTFLDFFMFLEESFPEAISLDDVAGCATVAELTRLLDRQPLNSHAGGAAAAALR